MCQCWQHTAYLCYYVCWVCLFFVLCLFECSPRGLGECFLWYAPFFYERLLCAAIYKLKASYSLQARHALWGCLHVFVVRQRQTHRRPSDSAATTLTISYVKVVIWKRIAWKLDLNSYIEISLQFSFYPAGFVCHHTIFGQQDEGQLDLSAPCHI